ncbi:MAG: cytochrome c oxidase assembly factor Coa1 family protein [Anaerolineae bacterium]
MDDPITGFETAPDVLTQNLVRANKFDADALDANRQGKLSAKQGWNMTETLGLAFAILFVVLGLLLACSIGFGSLNAGNWGAAAVPLAIGVALIAGIGVLFNLAKRTGADKYLTNRRDTLPRLFFLAIDLIRGQVACVEGGVTRSYQRREDSTRSQDGSTDTFLIDLYAYSAGGKEFYVEEAGYKAFPEWEQQCRLYYLPMSKGLVNIEALQNAPLVAQAPLNVAVPAVPPPAASPDRRAPDAPGPDHLLDRHSDVDTGNLAVGLATHLKLVRPMNPGAPSGRLTSSPVYTQALQAACADARVIAALGEPIQAGEHVTGSLSQRNQGGAADLVIPLSGSRNRGALHASARLEQDVWRFYTLEVKVDGQAESIPLGR